MKKTVFYLLLFAFAAAMLVPFLWSVYASLVKNDLAVGTFSFDLSAYGFNNYSYILSGSHIGLWYRNSLVVTIVVTLSNLLINTMAGYALARIPFRGSKAIFLTTLGMMMIPNQILLIPIFIMMAKLGWINTLAALIVPFLANPFGVFLSRQFFVGFPKELEEAARIDGLTRIGMFFRLALPLSGPALVAQAIFIFVWNWNSFIFPSILAMQQESFTLPVGIYQITRNAFSSSVTKSMAGVMLMTVPTLALFVVFQNYFVRSVTNSGIKG